jgi:hypothetical protein
LVAGHRERHRGFVLGRRRFLDPGRAIEHGLQLRDGRRGAWSTWAASRRARGAAGPGREEMQRVVPVVEALVREGVRYRWTR